MACICVSVCSCNNVCSAHVVPCSTNDAEKVPNSISVTDRISINTIRKLYSAVTNDLSDTNRRKKYWNPDSPNFDTIPENGHIRIGHLQKLYNVLNGIGGFFGFTTYLGTQNNLAYGGTLVQTNSKISYADIMSLRTAVVSLLQDCVCNSNVCSCNSVCACNAECSCHGYK